MRVSTRQAQKQLERHSRVALGSVKTFADVLGEIAIIEWADRDRPRLVEQRSALAVEKLVEHPRLGASEHVAGLIAMQLDLAAQQTVQPIIDAQEILELVERDDCADA